MQAVVHDAARSGPIDGLRGIAILLVLGWHGLLELPAKTLFWSGVDLFFVISGFLIGGILIRNRGADGYLSTFFIRRAARILPLYFLLLFAYKLALVVGVQSWPAFEGQFSRRPPEWMYWTFLQNLWSAETNEWGAPIVSVTWSLAVEEQFYLLAPFVIALVPPRFLPLACIGLIGFAPLFRMWAMNEVGHLAAHVLLGSRVDALAIGVLLAWLVSSKDREQFLNRSWPALLVPLVICGGVLWWLVKGGMDMSTPAMDLYGYTLIALFYGLVLLVMVTARNRWINAFFSFPLFRMCGVLCFSLYLVHLPYYHFVWNLWLKGPAYEIVKALSTPDSARAYAMLAFRLLGLLALCVALYYAVEKPFMLLGKRATYRRKPEPKIEGMATTVAP